MSMQMHRMSWSCLFLNELAPLDHDHHVAYLSRIHRFVLLDQMWEEWKDQCRSLDRLRQWWANLLITWSLAWALLLLVLKTQHQFIISSSFLFVLSPLLGRSRLSNLSGQQTLKTLWRGLSFSDSLVKFVISMHLPFTWRLQFTIRVQPY